MAVKLSVKGLADFMTASASRSRTLVRHFKYPNEDEPQARILYYREARDRIVAYHRGQREPSWLSEQAAAIEMIAATSTGRTKTRLRHNVRALQDYEAHFSDRSLAVLGELNLRLKFGNVVVTVAPDLHVTEGGREKLIKLEFGVTPQTPETVSIISQVMLEAAAGMHLAARDVVYWDVTRGIEHRSARLGSRRRHDIEAACQTFADIWNSI